MAPGLLAEVIFIGSDFLRLRGLSLPLVPRRSFPSSFSPLGSLWASVVLGRSGTVVLAPPPT
jgi:hypothetical protein